MMTQASDKTERLDKHRTRELILEAAERAFGDAGMKGATTREIARAAGINETTLFRHFASKDTLLMAVIEKGMQEAAEMISNDLKPCGNLPEDLHNFSQIYCRFLKRKEPMLRVCLSTMNHMPEEARQLFQVTNLPTVKSLAACLETAQKTGQMRTDLDCYQVSQAFLSTLMMFILKSSVIQTPYTQDEYFKTVIDLFLNGVKQPSGGSAS
jgi:AcrR family transcriptional regulator